MSAQTAFSVTGLFILMLTFQNCADKGGTLEVSVDAGSTGIPQGLPAPGTIPSPGTVPAPPPSPSGGATGANPLPLGLKATFRGGNTIIVGVNALPLDLNMSAPQKIEVDISSLDTAYQSNPVYAIPGVDYQPFAGQTLTFNPGDVSESIAITVIQSTGRFFSFSAANCKYGGVPFSCTYLF